MRLRTRIERLLAPGYSHCFRCGRPWKYAREHVTHYSATRGCFALCEACWLELGTPEERWPYYERLASIWTEHTWTYNRDAIRAAVWAEPHAPAPQWPDTLLAERLRRR